MLNKSIFKKIGKFETKYSTNTFDFNMWIRIASKYNVYFIDEILCDYRIHKDYNNGHIPGAIHISPKDKNFLQQRLDYYTLQWKKNNKTAVVVDNNGREANIFCGNMKLTTRYKHIYSLKEGMNLWTLPLEKGKLPSSGMKGKK